MTRYVQESFEATAEPSATATARPGAGGPFEGEPSSQNEPREPSSEMETDTGKRDLR